MYKGIIFSNERIMVENVEMALKELDAFKTNWMGRIKLSDN